MIDNVFAQIGIVLGLATVGGVLAQRLRQPLIVAFIAVGILVGPAFLGMVKEHNEIGLFARLGIALLLFVVGLKLDLAIIRSVGPVALASGLGQVFFTSVLGYLIGLALGFPSIEAMYIAVALTFSSTIIIVKLLSDKHEVDTLHGRIAVGFLIVQDIVVVLVMIGLTALGQSDADSGLHNIGREALLILLKGVLMMGTVALLMRYLLPWLLHRLAHSTELLMLFAIAWAVLGAIGGELLGFSREVGAFLAGVSIASTPYREQVAARLISLRDFLLLFFFIELGASLNLGLLGDQMLSAFVFSVFVLIGNPLIVMAIMGYMGYRKRTGFLAGLTVAQISEFSLILAALGFSLGHIGLETVSLVTLVGLITISLSTYMILYSHRLYERLSPHLALFERRKPFREQAELSNAIHTHGVLLIGLGRFGAALAEQLRQRQCSVLALDFDPEIVQRYIQDGFHVHYGDVEDPELVASLPLSQLHWIVSTIRDPRLNSLLLETLKQQGYSGRIAVTTYRSQDRLKLNQAGVDLVLFPYTDAARKAAETLTAGEFGHCADTPQHTTGHSDATHRTHQRRDDESTP
jgi:Kef-type K+ transport system membrane component KefB